MTRLLLLLLTLLFCPSGLAMGKYSDFGCWSNAANSYPTNMDTGIHRWPSDANGDVLRRLERNDFDFAKHYTVDFNIDFDRWPPCEEAIDAIRIVYPDAEIYEDGDEGYIVFRVNSLITYDFVMKTQSEATSLVAAYGGRCESWGVLHDSPSLLD